MKGKLKPTTLIGLALVASGLLILSALALTSLRAAGASPAQPEVVPSASQQKPIADLLAEQKRINDQKQAEISGAVRYLMSQLQDPVTKQVGLDPQKWQPTPSAEGVKFVQVPQTTSSPPQTPQ